MTSPFPAAIIRIGNTCALLEKLRGSQTMPCLQDINREVKTFTKLEYLAGNQMVEVVESGGVIVNALCMICVRRRSLLCAFALERPRSRFVYDPRLPDYPPACLAQICLRIRPGVLDPASGQRRLYWITLQPARTPLDDPVGC